MRSPQLIVPTWIPETLILLVLMIAAAVIVVIMAAMTLESIILRADARREKREKQSKP